MTWDWSCISYGSEGDRLGEGVAHHVAAQLCRGHGGEVGGAGVVFAAADDAYAAELAWGIVSVAVTIEEKGFSGATVPLWKLSSMGGTMLYTFLRRSFLAAAIV
jgi:hypothetical protein